MDGILFPDEDYLFAGDDMQFADKIIATIVKVDKCNEFAYNALKAMNKHLSKERFIEIVRNSIES